MKKFSQAQMDLISRAYKEFIKVHPDYKLDDDRRELLNARTDFAAKEEGFYEMVVESLPADGEEAAATIVEELVTLSEGRPAILIEKDDFDLANHETLPNVIRDLLQTKRDQLKRVIRGVGRIEVANHPRRSWLGTGFIVASDDGSDIVVTNRHVAVEMAYRRSDNSYQFVEGLVGGAPITAALDLKEEVVSVADDDSAAIPIVEVLYFEDASGPDLAFLRLEPTTESPSFNRLSFSPNIEEKIPIAAIGYPARDTTATDLAIVLSLLGDVFNKKRLAPGVLKTASANVVTHDCSTLGGNSGSPLIDLRTGEVVGLHAGGTFPNPENFGVSAQRVVERLDMVMRGRRGQRRTDTYTPRAFKKPFRGSQETNTMKNEIQIGDHSVTIEVPLRISVELGTLKVTSSIEDISQPVSTIEAAVEAARNVYRNHRGVVDIRSGVQFVNGRYTTNPAVIVAVDYTEPGSEATAALLPPTIQSFPIEVRAASAEDLARARGNVALEGVPSINYQKPTTLSLDVVEDEMFAVFHVSPDAGWPELQEFLSRTRESLTLGLYNFATDHVEAALVDAVSKDPRTFDLVLGDAGLDRPDTSEFEDRIVERFGDLMGNRFRFELADGQRRLFAGHYHIKVAVRDSRALWLSSGNWEPSNQPNVDPIATGETSFQLLRERNREWHAVILNEQLAQTFESYIRYDLDSYHELRTSVEEVPPAPEPLMFLIPETGIIEEMPLGNAKYFKPLVVRKRLRIQPLLTPDNYIDHVIALVESATQSIDLQNQTVKWRLADVDPRFEQLMNALLRKHQNGVEVRMILRGDFSPDMKELLIQHGFSPEQIRLQSRCHTKGMIVDSQRTLLGSHNLSEHGALANRDASLIIDDDEVAKYYKQIFQFDWDRASGQIFETPRGISIYQPGTPIPEGYEVVSIYDAVL